MRCNWYVLFKDGTYLNASFTCPDKAINFIRKNKYNATPTMRAPKGGLICIS